MTEAQADLATLKAMVETAQDHLFVVDAEGRILDVSPGAATVYGMPREALCATTVQALQASGVLSPSGVVEVIRSGQPAQLMQRTGTGRQVIAEAHPVYVGGRLVRVISRSRDLTDLRLLQDEYALLQQRFTEHLKRHHEAPAETSTEAGELVVKSRLMREITQLLKRSAPTDATVLMLGESGVGKTAFARQLHRWSRRRDGAFVDVNCAAIPESLFESEMFGYQPGAFSGAARQGKAGLLEQAHNGTLFLDEIGELPADHAVQAAQGDSGWLAHPARRYPFAAGRLPPGGGDQSRPGAAGGGGRLPARSLLSAQRHPGDPAAAA